ncbi:MAG: hypothetical protein V3U73_08625, partial [bacterium]
MVLPHTLSSIPPESPKFCATKYTSVANGFDRNEQAEAVQKGVVSLRSRLAGRSNLPHLCSIVGDYFVT